MKNTFYFLFALALPVCSPAFAESLEEGMVLENIRQINFRANESRHAQDITLEQLSPNKKIRCFLVVRDVLPRRQPFLAPGTSLKVKILDNQTVGLMHPETGAEKIRFACSHLESDGRFYTMETKDILLKALESTLGLYEKKEEIQAYPIHFEQSSGDAETSMDI